MLPCLSRNCAVPVDSYSLPRLSFTFDQWMRDTSRTLHVRSAELKALDILVDAYLKTPSPNNLQYLRRALATWKAKHGPGDAWRTSSRNARLYGFTKLDAELRGVGDSDRAFGQPDFMSEGMSNARLGILYLFANMRCDDGYFSIATNGILDLTGASLDFAGEQVENAAIGYAKTGLEQSKDTIMDGAKRVDEWSRARKEARRKVTSSQLLGTAPPSAGNGATRAAQQQVSDSLQQAATQVARSIALQTGENESTAPEESRLSANLWEQSPGALRMLCDYLGGKYLENAMPFISGGLATVNGLINAVRAGTTRYMEYSHGKSVNILPGHPSTIVREIRHAMDINVCAGMYQTLKGGAQLAVEGVTAGAASPISSLVFSLVEAIVSTTWKVHDLHRMRRFFDEAERQYTMRQQARALHTRPIAFNAWYRKYAVGTPAISVLALNSGICGDKMRFLQMYTNGDQINQSAFDAGVRYVDELKAWGGRYLDEVGYAFSSNDPLTKGVLTPVHAHPETEGFFQKRVLGSAQAFMGG
jgi:hypothetical protein